MEVNPIYHRKSALINSYVNGTLRAEDHPVVEKAIGVDSSLKEYFEKKIGERDFFQQLIPDPKMSKNAVSELVRELSDVTDEIYPKEKLHFFQKVRKVLDTSVFTIRY